MPRSGLRPHGPDRGSRKPAGCPSAGLSLGSVAGVSWEDGEPITPWLIHGVRRVQRWRSGHVSHHACRHVTLGALTDGRWMVEHSDVRVGSRAYPDEQTAREVAKALLAEGEWRRVPAEYDDGGQPTEPGWRRSGGDWYRGG